MENDRMPEFMLLTGAIVLLCGEVYQPTDKMTICIAGILSFVCYVIGVVELMLEPEGN